MDNTFFCKSFAFKTISPRAPHHTDNSRGIEFSFFARLKKGTARICPLYGDAIHLTAGDIFYLPSGLKYHSYWLGDENGEVEWDSYGFELLPIDSSIRFVPQKIECDTECKLLLDNIKKGEEPSPASVGYLYLFFDRVLPTMARDFASPEDKMLEKIHRLIAKDPELSVPELARRCGMSESSFYAFFRANAGQTPIEMKQKIQIKNAASLLETTDLSVEEIASRCAFHSTAYFRLIFKKHLGIPPTEHRRVHSEKSYL